MYGVTPRGRWWHPRAGRQWEDAGARAGAARGGLLGRGRAAAPGRLSPGGGEIVRAPRLSLAATYLIVLGIMLTTAPLGFRRRYPVGAFGVIMAAVLATNGHTSTVTFAAVLFAAYSAIVYSRY